MRIFTSQAGRRSVRALLLIALAVGVSACGLASPGVTFSPTGPCLADGRAAGAYPDLEALLPRWLEGRGPDRLDSGRNCTATNLGSLADHGIREVRFAGGLWDLAPQSGVTLAVFVAGGLTADAMGEFYESSARSARKVSGLVVTRPMIDGQPGIRLDYRDADTPGAIVVWPAPAPGTVRVVLAGGVPERIVQEAIAAFARG